MAIHTRGDTSKPRDWIRRRGIAYKEDCQRGLMNGAKEASYTIRGSPISAVATFPINPR